MSKWLSALVLLCAAAPARAQVEVSRHFGEAAQRRSFETIVRIRVFYTDRVVQGSGVCVRYANGASYILTCAHVLDGIERSEETVIEMFTSDSYPNPVRTHRARRVKWWRDRRADLALVVARVVVPASAKICRANTRVKTGTPVLAVGCGAGAPPVCQVGTVKGQDEVKDFVIDRGAIGGRSGGALFSAGGLIGILARRSDGQTHAVNHAKIHRFLRSTGHGWLVPQ